MLLVASDKCIGIYCDKSASIVFHIYSAICGESLARLFHSQSEYLRQLLIFSTDQAINSFPIASVLTIHYLIHLALHIHHELILRSC